MGKPRSRYEAAHSRWAGVGPYYAMFAAEFADQVIAKHTKEGDTVLDMQSQITTTTSGFDFGCSAVPQTRFAPGVPFVESSSIGRSTASFSGACSA